MQSRKLSFIEAKVNTILGFILAMLTVSYLFPLAGVEIPLKENFEVTSIMAIVSTIRSYFIRRFFNSFHESN